eukprot:1137308-Pelagomonas_calceolata.AAC.1
MEDDTRGVQNLFMIGTSPVFIFTQPVIYISNVNLDEALNPVQRRCITYVPLCLYTYVPLCLYKAPQLINREAFIPLLSQHCDKALIAGVCAKGSYIEGWAIRVFGVRPQLGKLAYRQTKLCPKLYLLDLPATLSLYIYLIVKVFSALSKDQGRSTAHSHSFLHPVDGVAGDSDGSLSLGILVGGYVVGTFWLQLSSPRRQLATRRAIENNSTSYSQVLGPCASRNPLDPHYHFLFCSFVVEGIQGSFEPRECLPKLRVLPFLLSLFNTKVRHGDGALQERRHKASSKSIADFFQHVVASSDSEIRRLFKSL